MAEESKLTVERLSALLGISDPDETAHRQRAEQILKPG